MSDAEGTTMTPELAALLERFLYEARTRPGAWLDPDELLNAVMALSRIPSKDQPGDWAALAMKINQLVDYLGMGGKPPSRLLAAQRVGPYARPVTQVLRIVWVSEPFPHAQWVCDGCEAPLLTTSGGEPDGPGYSITVTGKIEHRAPCTEVRE